MKLFSKYLFFAIAMILTSCGAPPTTQTPSSGFAPSQIKEPQIGAPYSEIVIQEIHTSNCDGANPTTTVSRSLIQEQTTFFEVAVEAGGLVRGTPIPTVLEGELETKIKAALGSNFGNKFEQTISTILTIEPGQAWKHKIFWNETKVKGIIDVVYQSGTATLNFEKVIGIELYDRTSESLVCDSNGVSILPASTASNNTPAAILETAPPPTQEVQAPTQAPSMEFVRREATGGYVTKAYNITLSDGEVIAGQGYGFQQQTGGCVAYIIKGSGQFNFSVTDGAWLYYRNVTTAEQIELLLQNQIDSLSQYGCTPSTVKIVRLP